MRKQSKGPGIIGRMGGGLSAHQLFWRIVKGYGIPPSDVERMTFAEMKEAEGYLDMTLDYRNAWQEFYEHRQELKNEPDKRNLRS